MTEINIYQVDAFTNQAFKGNPAGVCPLDEWLEDELMQNIALEMNLAETAFFVKNEKQFDLRWFTPVAEVDLCGHATLASAHLLFEKLDYKKDKVIFNTKSGILTVAKSKPDRSEIMYELDLPSESPAPIKADGLTELVSEKVVEWYKGTGDYLAILENEAAVLNCKIDLPKLAKMEVRGLIISAPGDQKDFVSRCFYPALGIDEDPVTGSAHSLITPYWAVKLNKNEMDAAQLSSRGGQLKCRLSSNRIILSGQAITVMAGKIIL